MRGILLVHVIAGGLGLISGYVALYAAKGATLHRKAGILFVSAMATMAMGGMLVSAVDGVAPAINVPSALLTFYLVITSLTTVRPFSGGSRPLDIAGLLMASGTGVACFILGISAITRGGREAGMAYPLFLFGGTGLAAAVGDLRMMRAGGTRGASRLVRHLWRMCFALFIASIAFYLGQGRVPEALRIPALLAGGVLLPIVAIAYWIWQIRLKPSVRVIVRENARQAA